MVRPGPPLLEDANDWNQILKFPDIDAWDWDASGRQNYDFLHNSKANMLWFLNGCWYEELFAKTTELYCRLVDRCAETYGDGISGFTVHDDWGSQRASFFSPAVGANLTLGNGFTLALSSGIILCVIGEVFMIPLLRLFGATDTVLPYAIDCGRIYLLGTNSSSTGA